MTGSSIISVLIYNLPDDQTFFFFCGSTLGLFISLKNKGKKFQVFVNIFFLLRAFMDIISSYSSFIMAPVNTGSVLCQLSIKDSVEQKTLCRYCTLLH